MHDIRISDRMILELAAGAGEAAARRAEPRGERDALQKEATCADRQGVRGGLEAHGGAPAPAERVAGCARPRRGYHWGHLERDSFKKLLEQ